MTRWIWMCALLTTVTACGDDDVDDTDTDTDTDADTDSDTDSDTEPAPSCEAGSRDGPASGSDNELTARNVRFTVRMPANYDPTVAYPLAVVYPPAGGDPEITEQFTGLTPTLTGGGYIVAYPDHRSPSSGAVIADFGTVPGLIAAKWCVDESRVHFTGHSDGGSIATVLAVASDDYASIAPLSIAPSAAGTSGAWFAQVECPYTMPVMVQHSSNDGLFPGFGAEAATWWADCNGCSATPSSPDSNGCVTYPDCTDGVEVTYCEHSGSHGTWPRNNDEMLSFFDGS